MWPDNVPAANVFISMSTQWRVGMGGATGLDYSALPVVFDLLCIKNEMRPSIFDDLRVMEDSALETMREKNK